MNTMLTPGWLTVAAICAVALLSVGFLSLGLPGQIRRQFATKLPETGARYTVASVEAFIARVGKRGLRMYRRQLAWDMVYALLVSIAFVPILRGLWVSAFVHPGGLLRMSAWAFPAIFLGAELLEDSFLLKALPRADPEPDRLSWKQRALRFFKGGLRRGAFRTFSKIRSAFFLLAARWATRAKFAALGVMASLLVGGLVLLWIGGAGSVQGF